MKVPNYVKARLKLADGILFFTVSMSLIALHRFAGVTFPFHLLFICAGLAFILGFISIYQYSKLEEELKHEYH